MTDEKDIIKIVDKVLQHLPSDKVFSFYNEYQNIRESINLQDLTTRKENALEYQYMEIVKTDVFDFLNRFNYLEKEENKLSEDGNAAKRLGHGVYQQRLRDIQDGEWYKSKLAKSQFNDYPNVVKRSWISILISFIALLLSAIALLIKWKCQ